MSPSCLLLFLISLLLPPPTTPYITSGSLDTLSSWRFIDRFCFVPHEMDLVVGEVANIEEAEEFGLFQWTITFPEDADLYLQVFYQKDGLDTWDDLGWGSVYLSEKMVKRHPERMLTCPERHYYAAKTFRLRSQLNTKKIVTRSEKNMQTNGFAYFKTPAPKFFFVAISNCDPACACDKNAFEGSNIDCVPASSESFCDGPLVLDYTFEFTNGDDVADQHFGYDEIGLLHVCWVFSVFYVLLLSLVNKTVRSTLRSQNKYHISVRMLVYSVWLTAAGVGSITYHYMRYSKDGVGDVEMETFGKMLFSLGEILLVLHLILVAKGWTIVRRKISANGRMKIAIYITLFAFIHLVTRYYMRRYMDKGVILYEYETDPGKFLRCGRVFAAIWFIYSVHTTMKQFPTKKRRFYRNFSSIFGLWFVWLMVLSFLPDAIPTYMRYKFSFAFELTMFFAAHCILVVMYNPNFSANFPFHSNASHEIMTGRFSRDVFTKELNNQQRRSPKRDRKDCGFRKQGSSNRFAAQDPSPSMDSFPSPNSREQQSAQAPSTPTMTPLSPIPVAPLNTLFGREIPVQAQYAFSSVSEATSAVRVAGDDVSEILHDLTSNLDSLDDAINDWDEDLGGEYGETYDAEPPR